MESSCSLNIFQLSSLLEEIAPIRIQVVLGLGGSLFGAIYCGMFYARNYPFILTGLRLANVFLLFLAYLFVLRVYSYRTLDVLIFLLAIHGRALKTIIAATDTAKEEANGNLSIQQITSGKDIKKKKKEKRQLLDIIFVPNITEENIPFDKTLEELVFRLLVVANIHIIYRLPFSSFVTIGKGLLYTTLSYGIRYTESVITKKTRPGYLNRDAYSIYAWFMHIIFITELYTV